MNAALVALLAVAALAAPGPAGGRREQLKALVAELQSAPSDELRRRIIKLAASLKPAPALPEEAKRCLVRGAAAVKGAKDASDWRLAVEEFSAAASAAPWSSDIYYNLAVAQDKAADFDAALRTLALAELAAPGSEDVKTLRYEVEFRKEKSPEARARRDAEFLKGLDGALYETPWTSGLGVFIRIEGGNLAFLQERRESRVCLCAEDHRCGGPLRERVECGDRIRLEGRKAERRGGQVGARFEVAEDGESITKKDYWLSKWDELDKPMNTELYKRVR